MHQVFATVVRPLLTAVEPKTVLEVGAGQGRLTRWLVQHSQATVHAVDPAPAFDADVLANGNGRLVVHTGRSLNVLRSLPAADLAILDGDPNWYTVITELRVLAGDQRAPHGSLPVIVLHNLDWPFGRRDGYYEPDAIPEAWRSPNAALGLLPGDPTPSEEGLALVPFVGLEDRLPRSGVRTAIEDFLAENPDQWRFVDLPGLHGVGVLAPWERLSAHPKLAQVLDGYERTEFLVSHLDTVERERIAALISSGTTEVDAERVDALQVRLELLERDRDGRLLDEATRLRMLEQASIEARVRYEVAERELERDAADLRAARARVSELERALDDATTKVGGFQMELELTRDSAHSATVEAAEQFKALQAARDENQQLHEGLSTLLEERVAIAGYVDRAARSHAWRIGHRLTSFARLVTFRRNRGTSALARVQERLAPSPPELPPGPAPSLPQQIAAGEPEEPLAAT